MRTVNRYISTVVVPSSFSHNWFIFSFLKYKVNPLTRMFYPSLSLYPPLPPPPFFLYLWGFSEAQLLGIGPFSSSHKPPPHRRLSWYGPALHKLSVSRSMCKGPGLKELFPCAAGGCMRREKSCTLSVSTSFPVSRLLSCIAPTLCLEWAATL